MQPKLVRPILLSVQKIWDFATHNAMTDLIFFNERWYCTFRESDMHVHGEEGCIRILSSKDGITWASVKFFEEEGVDLRDPKLSIDPNGQLMLLAGGTVYDADHQYQYLQSRVSFSMDGIHWTPFKLIIEPHEWLWRVTWHDGKAYGASYSRSVPSDKKKEWNIKLYESPNGIDFTMLTQWEIYGYPNETTLRFLDNGEMVALVRRDKQHDNKAWIGISQPPYTEWHWKPSHLYFGGPNFIVGPHDILWAAGRILFDTPYLQLERTVVGCMDLEDIYPLLILPSGGDCSYPGMVLHENMLWVSYYSSHESNTSIYLARIVL